jgi:hypothetical protein
MSHGRNKTYQPTLADWHRCRDVDISQVLHREFETDHPRWMRIATENFSRNRSGEERRNL